MTSPWAPVECDQCVQPMFTELMEKQWLSHGFHHFPMKFHEFSMGYPWGISVREMSVLDANIQRYLRLCRASKQQHRSSL